MTDFFAQWGSNPISAEPPQIPSIPVTEPLPAPVSESNTPAAEKKRGRPAKAAAEVPMPVPEVSSAPPASIQPEVVKGMLEEIMASQRRTEEHNEGIKTEQLFRSEKVKELIAKGAPKFVEYDGRLYSLSVNRDMAFLKRHNTPVPMKV
jgi:hypothetical protein